MATGGWNLLWLSRVAIEDLRASNVAPSVVA